MLFENNMGKVRPLDRRFVRISGDMVEKVERFARLAGLSVDEVIDFVLAEVLEDDILTGRPLPVPQKSPARCTHRPHRSGPPAAVIPITRNRPEVRGSLNALECVNLLELRRNAVRVREAARNARTRAAAACSAADSARANASNVLHGLALALTEP
jgi:hypothetical protein